MSGSTENLLEHSHLRGSDESFNKSQEKLIQDKRKLQEKNNNNKGIINPAFIGDEKHRYQVNSSPYKRATSFQQRSSSSFPSATRRHSSPDGSKKHRVKQKSKHGLTSASEEDLRRKAVLNSMKAERRFQSVSHLPKSVEKEAQNIGERSPTKTREDSKIRDKEEFHKDEFISRSTKDQIQESALSTSTTHQEENSRDNVVLALERAQLQQYKRRLTLALSERAKLTNQLQYLSANMAHNMSSSFETELPYSPRSETSSIVGESPRRPLYTSSPRYPAISDVNEATERCLPSLPSKDKTKKIGELNLEELESSRDSDPTHAVRIVDDGFGNISDKDLHETKSSIQDHSNHMDTFTKKRRETEKEDLDSKANDMWNKHLSGETFATGERQDVETKDSSEQKHRTKDENDNDTKKPLTVEEFLSSDKEPKDTEVEFDENDKAIRRVLGSSSRYSPELYEPLHDNGHPKPNKQPSSSTKNNSKPTKDPNAKANYDASSGQDYELLHVDRLQANRKHADYHYVEMTGQNARELDLHANNLRPMGDRRFNYMGPPGTINTDFSTLQQNRRPSRRDSSYTLRLERAPSSISDKLRYYRGVFNNENEERTAPRDLADALASETDPVKRREIQQQAAAEAAILRREASELLFEAMNLERLCDPNARVRHVYIPH